MNVLLAVATFFGVLAVTAATGGQVDYDGAVPLALFLALLVLARRRWPLTVLLLSVAAIMAFRTGDLTDAGWVWPASVAYFTVAESDRRGRFGLAWAMGIGAFELLFAVAWDGTVVGSDNQQALGRVGVEALWLALVLAAGAALRNRARWQAEVTTGLRRLENEQRLRSRQRSAEERLQIARELHDVVAHTLTVVGVQLRVATAALEDSPDEAREALQTAQHVRAKAVTDLRSLIDVLRDSADGIGEEQVASVSTLDNLDDLIERTRSTGLDVTVDVTGDAAAVPAVVALAIYRIVQESLTNTVRHSRATHATVDLTVGSDNVNVIVTDDGIGNRSGEASVSAGSVSAGSVSAGSVSAASVSAASVSASSVSAGSVSKPPNADEADQIQTAPAPRPDGHGVTGMRERVAALGGTFRAGANPDGPGYAVHATIPMAGSRP